MKYYYIQETCSDYTGLLQEGASCTFALFLIQNIGSTIIKALPTRF